MTGAASARPSFASLVSGLQRALDSLSSRTVILFGGKGGVGKTTIASLAALRFAASRPVTLFTTDPASSLPDLLGSGPIEGLTIEQLDADSLYREFLGANLEAFLELGDRGTYLDRDELRRFFELSLPGIDELMGWLRITEVASAASGSLLIVDTAPTGHTLRLLGSAAHFEQFGQALESMQAKHRELVAQLTRRSVRDAMDAFVDDFRKKAERGRAVLSDATRTAFIPVALAQPWVVEQTARLIAEVQGDGLDVPFAVLNQTSTDCDCPLCGERRQAEVAASSRLQPVPAVPAPRACRPPHDLPSLRQYLGGRTSRAAAPTRGGKSTAKAQPLSIPAGARIVFFAGKGGVGKTTAASSVALQLAHSLPDSGFTLISVDPAHSVRDVFASEQPPANLAVETVDTRGQWEKLRATLGSEIDRAIDGITPSGFSLGHDAEVMKQLIDIGPPGADEIFALMRLHELLERGDQALVLVDTAPTGHFLRLLELPRTAGEWVREFMRILLHYRELIPPGRLGEELLAASRALQGLVRILGSEEAAAVIVTRAEPVVIAETLRLVRELERRTLRIAGVIVNALTPETGCACDRTSRGWEMDCAAALPSPRTLVERRPAPVTSLSDLRKLIPIAQTGRP